MNLDEIEPRLDQLQYGLDALTNLVNALRDMFFPTSKDRTPLNQGELK